MKLFLFQDFSRFSDDNFNMKDWINNALQPQVDSSAPVDVSYVKRMLP